MSLLTVYLLFALRSFLKFYTTWGSWKWLILESRIVHFYFWHCEQVCFWYLFVDVTSKLSFFADFDLLQWNNSGLSKEVWSSLLSNPVYIVAHTAVFAFQYIVEWRLTKHHVLWKLIVKICSILFMIVFTVGIFKPVSKWEGSSWIHIF